MAHSFDGNGMPETFRQSATINLFPVAKNSGGVSGASARNEAPMSRNHMSMDLFSQQSGFVSQEEVPKRADSSVNNKSEPETAQVTISYAGQLIVFNDLPVEKAKEVMLLASQGSPHYPGAFASTPVQKPIEPTNVIPAGSSVVSNLANNMVQERIQRPPQPVVSDLPLAMKASQSRFWEKRNDRAILHKKIYPQNSSPKATAKKYLETSHMHNNDSEDDEMLDTATDGSKWVKTDSEFIVLEL